MPIVFYWERDMLLTLAKRRGIDLCFREYLSVDDGEDMFVFMYRWIIDRCPFLHKNICLIHRTKPLSCKMFPLVLSVPDCRLYLSAKCRWVSENISKVQADALHEVFDEFDVAIRVLCLVKEFLDEARRREWKVKVYG